MRGQERIDEMWAWIVVDDDGTEGIPAYLDPGTTMWAPMVGADADRVRSLRAHAKEAATIKQRAVELVRFTARESMGWLKPGKPRPSREERERNERNLFITADQVMDTARDRVTSHPYTAFDEQQMGAALVVDNVLVTANIIDGKPGVGFVFIKDDKSIPCIAVPGDQVENVIDLIKSAFEGAKRALN